MHPKIHIGAFEGENLARAAQRRPEQTAAQDIAGILAMLAFCAAVAFVAVAAVLPDIPA